MIDPNILLQGKNPQIETPLDAAAGAQSLQNLGNQAQIQRGQIAAQPGQLEAQQLQNQQTQQQINQTKTINDAYASALTPGVNGAPATFDTGKLQNALATHNAGSAIPGLMKGILDSQKAATDLAAQKNKLATDQADYFGAIGKTAKDAGYNPQVLVKQAQQGITAGAIDPAVAQPIIAEITQALQTDPTGAQAANLTKQLADHLISMSPAQQKLANEAETAQGAAQRGAAAAGELTLKQNAAATQDAATRLSQAKTAPDYAAILNTLPHGVALKFPPAESWNAQTTPQAALQAGMTPDQQVTTAETKARDANAEARGNATLGIDRARLDLERQKAANAADPLAGLSGAELQRIKLVANGDIPAPPARSAAYQRTMDAVLAMDPTYTESRYLGTKAFKTGGDANALVGMTTALAHLDQAKANSAALGTAPLEGFNLTPNQHRYTSDVDLLTGEIGKLVKSGVVTEGESSRLTKNLNSMFQGNRDAALDELKMLMAGKIEGIAQKYKNSTGRDIPLSMFDPATQARMKKYNIGAGAAGSPPAPPAPNPVAPVTPNASPGSVSVTDPNGGVHVFPNEAAAQVFKVAVLKKTGTRIQ